MTDFTVCLTNVLDKNKDLTKSDLKGHFDSLTDASKSRDFALKAAKIQKKTLDDVQRELQDKATTILKRRELEKFFDDSSTLSGLDKIRAKVTGVGDAVKGGNRSYEAQYNTAKNRLYNKVKYSLGDNIALLKSGGIDAEVADTVLKLKSGASVRGVAPEIVDLAKGIKAINDDLLQTLRDSGINIKERADYFARQTHDPLKIKTVDRDVWISDIEEAITLEGFEDLADGESVRDIIGKIYDDIKENGMEGSVGFSVKGKRTFHFKDGKSWAQYNDKYGKGTLLDTVISSVEATAKASSASTIFGPNAKQTFDWYAEKVGKSLEGKEKAKFQSKSTFSDGNDVDSYRKSIFGYDYDTSKDIIAKIVRVTGEVQAMSKLGKAVLSTLPDTAFSNEMFKAATGTKGVTLIKTISNFMSVLPTSERDRLAKQLDFHTSTLQAEVYDRMGASSDGIVRNGSSSYSNFRDTLLSANLLEAQSSRAKVANAVGFAQNAYSLKNKGFDELNPTMQKELGRFDITAKDWDVIKKGLNGADEIITPEAIRALGNTKEIRQIADKYSNYLGDSARVGSPEATIQERIKVNQGYSSTDPMGAFFRILMQFKSFPLAQMRVFNRIGQTAAIEGGKMGKLKSMASLGAAAGMYAMMGQVVKDAVKGKETTFDSEFVAKAYISSVLPLSAQYFVDMLRGEYKQFGRSIIKDIAGPTIGSAADVLSFLEGDINLDSKSGLKAFKILQKNLPGYNMPIAGEIINYTFMNSFYEMMEPGYGAKKQRRDLKNGNKYHFDRSAQFGD